jgi:hypothetical protein
MATTRPAIDATNCPYEKSSERVSKGLLGVRLVEKMSIP